MALNLLSLPREVQAHVVNFLDTRELLPWALVCKQTYAGAAHRLDTSVALDGTSEAGTFVRRYRNHARGLICSHGHALRASKKPRSNGSSSSEKEAREHKACRVDRIKELHMYDVRPIYSWHTSPSSDDSDGDVRPSSEREASSSPSSASSRSSSPPPLINHIRNIESVPGNLVGYTLSLLPNLETLIISQCPVPLNAAFAYAISVWAPKLRRLTLRSPHVDASALAALVRSLEHLEELEVGSVKTCWCRGKEGRREGALELAGALRGAKGLQRVVFNSSAVTGVDNGALFNLLASVGHHPSNEATDTQDVAERESGAGRTCRGSVTESTPQHHRHPHDHHYHHDRQQHHPHGGSRASSGCRSSRANPTRKPCTTFAPKSIELRRSPLQGAALVHYLSSPSATRLRRLFIGGCKAVRSGHLASLVAPGQSKAFASSSEPLYLELDARMLSREFLLGLSHRIVYLRIFEPADSHIQLLEHCLALGGLSRCRHLVVCPQDEDSLGNEDEDCMDLDMDLQQPRLAPSSQEALHHIQQRLQRAAETFSGAQRHFDVSIGDTAWWKMTAEKQAMRRWARMTSDIAAKTLSTGGDLAVSKDVGEDDNSHCIPSSPFLDAPCSPFGRKRARVEGDPSPQAL